MLISEILTAAKERIKVQGWHNGSVFADGDMYKACWLIGLYCYHPGEYNRRDVGNLLREVLGVNELATWNDAPDRTVDEVYAALDQTIALAKERGI